MSSVCSFFGPPFVFSVQLLETSVIFGKKLVTCKSRDSCINFFRSIAISQ